MADCKIGYHLSNTVFNREVNALIEAFKLALDGATESALGCLESRTIDQKLICALIVYLFIALTFVKSIVFIIRKSI